MPVAADRGRCDCGIAIASSGSGSVLGAQVLEQINISGQTQMISEVIGRSFNVTDKNHPRETDLQRYVTRTFSVNWFLG